MNAASHIVMGLHRAVCTLNFERCVDETYNEDGINDRIATIASVIMIVNVQRYWIRMAAWILVVPLVVMLFMVEHSGIILPILAATVSRCILLAATPEAVFPKQ
jgi:hypothetical protein